MYIRKLVKSGLSSFVVAVPQDWIKKNNLKKGDLVYMQEKTPDQLILSTEFKEDTIEKKELVINIDGRALLTLKFEIISAYLNNYYRIILKGKELMRRAEYIREVTHSLIALEIFEETSDKIVLRNFLDLKDISIKGLIRRIDNITRSMMLDTLQCLNGEDLHEVIYARDKEVNRLCYLIFKLLKASFIDIKIAKSLDLSNIEMLAYWEANIHCEKIADETKRISRLIHQSKRFDKRQLKVLISDVIKQYNDCMTAFYKRDKDLSDQVALRRQDLSRACDAFSEKNKGVAASEIAGKLKGILSRSSDVSRLTRYIF